MLDPDAIAADYMAVLKQPRSAWSHRGRAAALGRDILISFGGKAVTARWPEHLLKPKNLIYDRRTRIREVR